MNYFRLTGVLLLFFTAFNAQNKKDSSFNFVAFGDMPYFLPADYARFETVIKTINNLKPQFSIHVGDFKASATPCSDTVFLKMSEYFTQFKQPLIYTPGDNEWTDCTKKVAGPYDPEERLETLRKMFFKEQSSLGQQKMPLISQSLQTGFSKYVENNRWQYMNVAFATIHIVGSNNNFLSNSTNNNAEFYDRQKADLAWLEEVFKAATEKKNAAIVLAIQADMFFAIKDKDASGYNQIKKRLKELTLEFKKPVVLINGDSHVFIVDKPLLDETKAKASIDNFTRVQVPGENNMNAVKITVHPYSANLFQFEEIHVPN